MKRKLALLLATFVLCFTCCFAGTADYAFADDDQGFLIKNYKVEAQLHENNSIDIVETIKVNFYERKHGIYREIPERFKFITDEKDVYNYECKVSDVSVDNEWDYGESDDYSTVIKIGDPDRKVKGIRKYTISYSFTYPDDRIGDFDFLYHNILGNSWKVPIEHFSFNMKFDKKLPEESLQDFQVYSGSTGNIDNSLNVKYDVSKNAVSGSADNIGAHKAITVYTILPEGYFINEKTASPVLSILGSIIALAGVIMIILKALRTRRKKPVVTVEFNAPDGISPAEVGTIVDETVDDQDLLSLIPWFAEKGYLKLKVIEIPKIRNKTKKVIVLTKIKNIPEDAPEYQKKLFNAFFYKSDECVLDNMGESFGKEFIKSKNSLEKMFSGEKKLSEGTGTALLLSAIVTIGAAMFYTFSSYIAPFENFVPGIFAAVFFATAYFACSIVTTGKGKIKITILIIIMYIVEFGNVMLFCNDNDCQFPAGLSIAVFLASAVSCILSSRIVGPTDYKVQMLGKLLGLREFIKTAEIDKLNMLTEENPDYFFDVLPFAMAFGLEEKWSKHFENIDVRNPKWYSGNTDSFSTIGFCNMIDSNVSAPVSRAVSSASSSSGSGGSSGGGGGGGGGGSW